MTGLSYKKTIDNFGVSDTPFALPLDEISVWGHKLDFWACATP